MRGLVARLILYCIFGLTCRKGSFSRHAPCLCFAHGTCSLTHCIVDPHRPVSLYYVPHPGYLPCALRREEVDDVTFYEDGLHVDAYGDECGEWFAGTGVTKIGTLRYRGGFAAS